MAISAVQQEGLSSSPSFRAQVNAVVREQALLKDKAGNESTIASVARTPDGYGFPETIVADSTWPDTLTFDTWAANPTLAATKQAILGQVQKHFDLLTGYKAPEPPAP